MSDPGDDVGHGPQPPGPQPAVVVHGPPPAPPAPPLVSLLPAPTPGAAVALPPPTVQAAAPPPAGRTPFPPPPVPQPAGLPPRSSVALLVATVALVVSLIAGLVVAVPAIVGTAGRWSAAGLGTGPAGATTHGTEDSARTAAIGTVLDARGTAVVHDDLRGWKATQTSYATAPAFSRLRALPITRWRYEVRSDVATAPDVDSLLVDVHMRLSVDTADAIVSERMTLQHTASGWLVSHESSDSQRLQPWDLGDLSVVAGRHSLVIGIDQRPEVLQRYADIADAVTPDVTAIWGTDWNQHPVVIVPKSLDQLARALSQSDTFLTDFAAVTTGESKGAPPSRTAFRVWTNTVGLSDVSTLGREVVLRHEITHVATAAPATPGVPLWLEEGFAEYVGYSGTGIPERSAWSELVTAVRKGKAPTSLPTDAQFHHGAIDLAYESSDLACRMVADTYGQAALVKLYRAVRSGTGTPAENLDHALREVTGKGTPAFVIAWRARMAALR